MPARQTSKYGTWNESPEAALARVDEEHRLGIGRPDGLPGFMMRRYYSRLVSARAADWHYFFSDDECTCGLIRRGGVISPIELRGHRDIATGKLAWTVVGTSDGGEWGPYWALCQRCGWTFSHAKRDQIRTAADAHRNGCEA